MGVCLPINMSVFLYDISKTDAARITILDREIVHHGSWKLNYFGVKRLRSRSRSQKHTSCVGFCTLMNAGFF